MTLRIDIPPGHYWQGDLPLRRQLKDDHVPLFCRLWLQGKQPRWIGRQVETEAGGPMHWRMVLSHGKRLEAAGILPAGSGSAPVIWEERERRQQVERDYVNSKGQLITTRLAPLPGVRITTERRGRPKHTKAEATAGLDGQPIAEPQQTGLDWRTQRRLRLEREAQETAALLAGVTSLPDTPSPPSPSTPAADEDRIRGHGAEPPAEIVETKLRLDTSSTQEEGTTNASTQERPPDPTRPADQTGIDEAPQTPAGEARRVTPRPRRQRRPAGEGEPPQHQPRQQRRNARIRQGAGEPQGEPGASSGDSGED